MGGNDEDTGRPAEPVLATVMFADIVGSTERAAALGDRRWGDLLARFQDLVREELARHGGRELDTAGDGFFASFDRPASAVRCACSVSERVGGLGVRVRVGLHTGECEVVGEKLGGITVHIGARAAEEAQPGEVLVSSTVKELLAGSDLRFTDRSVRALGGVPGEWRLFAVDTASPLAEPARPREPVRILGRETEQALIDRVLDDARASRSGALLIRGEPGIGKTALCEYAVERAEGMRVLRCRGLESETELAFAALGDLFRPVLDHLDALPQPQRDALAGAIAVGPPATRDRYTVCAATFGLLAAVAEDRPVLVVVRGARWLDASSAEALLFGVRRLESEGVATIVAARTGEAPLFEQAGLDELTLEGLDRRAAADLLEAALGRKPAAAVAGRLHEATAGNPLALLEAAQALGEAELTGKAPLPDPLPSGPTIERAFLHRAEALPEATRVALLVAAAGEAAGAETILRALEGCGVERPRDALEIAEAAGLVGLEDDRIEFRHPLIRSAVYHGAPAPDRRAAHEALAAAAAGEAYADRRAWHLAAAAPGPDESAASALERTALSARSRGGHDEAASAFERAAGLASDASERARFLLEAARDFRRAGRADDALRLLDEALMIGGGDPRFRADVQHLRGRVEMWRGAGHTAYDQLAAEAAPVVDLDAAKAAVMLTDAVMLAIIAGDLHAAEDIGGRACEAGARAGGPLLGLTQAALGAVLLLRGEAIPDAAPAMLLEAFEAGGDVGLPAHQLSNFAGTVLAWLERYDEARRLLVGIVERARAASSPPELPYALTCLSDLDFRTGRWAAAYAGASESVRLAEETRQTGALPYSLVCLGRVEATTGREDEARAHLTRALELSAENGAVPFEAFARSALGLLELGLGRPEEAVGHLESVATIVSERGLGEPGVIQWAPDLIEAYVRVGRPEEAEATLGAFAAQAEGTGRTWALAAAARCRGLLAGEDGFEEEFRAALSLHEAMPTPFERARTELCLGERLRRARRRADSREWLRSALERFERLGAVPWLERARTELGATGERARRSEPLLSQELTPQELQVALVVAQGATNKEAGTRLFLSPKTIETHLGRVYRKLNVRSRTELARLLASEGALEEVAAA